MSFFNLFGKSDPEPIIGELNTYRTRDGQAYFRAKFVKMPEGFYEIDIHGTPSYQDRTSDSYTAHWLPNQRETGRKVCFTDGKEPRDLKTAESYFIDWCELTWKYIQTGITIEDQVTTRSN